MQILGISANDTFSQRTFADSLKLPFPLLSDHPDLKAIRSYAGPQPHFKDPTRQLARRSFFLIDKKGVVRGRWIAENDTLLLSEEILKVTRQIAKNP